MTFYTLMSYIGAFSSCSSRIELLRKQISITTLFDKEWM